MSDKYKSETVKPLNSFVLSGRLGKDPELTYTQAGKALCKLNLATDRYDYASKSKVTTWVGVTLSGATAENAAKYLAKGREVSVTCLDLRATVNTENNALYLDAYATECKWHGNGNDNDSKQDNQRGDTPLF